MTFHPRAHIELAGLSIHSENYRDILSNIETHEPWIKDVMTFLGSYLDTSDTIVLNTSGTTGSPKSITVSKDKMRFSAEATGKYFGLQPGQTALLPLPASYIAGKMMIVRALTLGLRLIIIQPGTAIFENPLPETIDFAPLVPLQLSNNLSNPSFRQKVQKIRTIILGGAAVNASLREETCRLSNAVYETFGMTETLSHIAVRQINLPGEEKPFSALPGVSFGTDERNCLIIHAPGLLEEDLITNDVIDLITDTSFFWKGRFDNVINSGGIKIFPEVLEQKLESLVHDPFFIASLPDEKLGQRVILVVEKKADKNISIHELFNQMQKILPLYSAPKEVYLLPEFFRNKSGKIVRKETMTNILSGKQIKIVP